MNNRERQVEAFVRAAPDGVTKHAVAALLGISAATAAKYLYEVRKAGGTIDATESVGPLARWGATELREALREKFRTVGRSEKNIRHAECERIRREYQKDEAADSWPVVQRIVPAAGAKSIRRPMVASVWDLAR